MAKKNDDVVNSLAKLLTIIIMAGLWLFKEVIEGIILLIKDIVTFLGFIIKLLFNKIRGLNKKGESKMGKSNWGESNDEGIKAPDVVAGLVLGGLASNNKSDTDEELEEEMDNYDLEDWQKDLVRDGDYDSWGFEEDGELEEDDYYSEDEF